MDGNPKKNLLFLIKPIMVSKNLNLPEDPEELDFSAHIEDVSQNLPHLKKYLYWLHYFKVKDQEKVPWNQVLEDKRVTTSNKVKFFSIL